MNEVLEILQRKLAELNDRTWTVESLLDQIAQGKPIRMSEELVNRMIKIHPPEGMSDLTCTFEGEHIILTGTAKVMLMPVAFRLELKPTMAKGRRLQFDVIDLKPALNEGMKKRLLKDAQGVTYENNKLSINLNEIDLLKEVPFGKLAGIRIKDKVLWCKIVI